MTQLDVTDSCKERLCLQNGGIVHIVASVVNCIEIDKELKIKTNLTYFFLFLTRGCDTSLERSQ